ncbi:MAG TPA: hypothetical protein VIP11_17915 [Gemmatimonadaceae bacterium]
MRAVIWVVRAVGALAFLSRSMGAQSLRVRPSVELSTGTALGGGGVFRDRDLYGARVAVGFRVLRPGSFAVFADLVGDAVGFETGHTADCRPSPRGGCLESYPTFAGAHGLVGIMGQPNGAVEWRAAIGGGAYRGDGATVGGVVAQADVGIFPFSHLGGFAGVRTIVIPRFRHDRLWMIPWMIGVRVR